MDNIVITIARGFGSGGKEIGRLLGEKLGIPCYEKRILTLASQLSGVQLEAFEEVNEKIRTSRFSSLLQGLPLTRTIAEAQGEFVSDNQLFQIQKEIIEDLAKNESCIIVGKCADWILKDYPNVISVYIEAPRPFCLRRIMEKMKVNADVANLSITKTDQYRAAYYRHYTGGKEWTDPTNYDLTLNSERLGLENCVQVISSCIEVKFPEYIRKLKN